MVSPLGIILSILGFVFLVFIVFVQYSLLISLIVFIFNRLVKSFSFQMSFGNLVRSALFSSIAVTLICLIYMPLNSSTAMKYFSFPSGSLALYILVASSAIFTHSLVRSMHFANGSSVISWSLKYSLAFSLVVLPFTIFMVVVRVNQIPL